ncbi:hypothetical protein CB1_001431032 [Camelus ferus]|nr:hypothetical protein CB1_001431032 [Camelus ferus]
MGVVHSSFGTRGKEKNLYLAPSVLNGEENIDFSGCKNKPLTMIDSSKKQQQGFPEILTAGDFEPLKEKECLEGSNQKSLKEDLVIDSVSSTSEVFHLSTALVTTVPPLSESPSSDRTLTGIFTHVDVLAPCTCTSDALPLSPEAVLQLRLQQRRTREQLVDQGIMPQTFAEPSLQATQMKLKRARLADDLNEKIAQRPGPMELFTSVSPAVPEFLKTPTTDQPPTRSTAPILPTNTVSSAKPGPTLVKQSHPKNPNDKHRSKKCKDPKPRVKKLKYHQYIPPDQKGEKNEPQMDSNYARLLQQQQLFLQLQILSQQQQHYNYQTILPAPLKYGLGPVPASCVSELKTELKLRGLPVSGTKPDLIERLKPYQEMNSSGVAAGGIVAVSTSAIVTSSPEVAMALPVTALHSSVTSSGPAFKAELPSAGAGGVAHVENVSSPLPISPSPSEQSSLSAEDTSVADTFTEIMTMMSPSQFLCSSPLRATSNEDSLSPTSSTLSNLELDAAEKDRKLQEKEKQIEELKRKLEQEQKLVEVLKMQLEPGSPPPPQPFVVQHSLFGSPVPKTKDPPRYEEAIKQTRSAQSALPEVSRAGGRGRVCGVILKLNFLSKHPLLQQASPHHRLCS